MIKYGFIFCLFILLAFFTYPTYSASCEDKLLCEKRCKNSTGYRCYQCDDEETGRWKCSMSEWLIVVIVMSCLIPVIIIVIIAICCCCACCWWYPGHYGYGYGASPMPIVAHPTPMAPGYGYGPPPPMYGPPGHHYGPPPPGYGPPPPPPQFFMWNIILLSLNLISISICFHHKTFVAIVINRLTLSVVNKLLTIEKSFNKKNCSIQWITCSMSK